MKKILLALAFLCCLSSAASAVTMRFIPITSVWEDTAWISTKCNTPTTVFSTNFSYAYAPCRDNGTWSSGDFTMRFVDFLPPGLTSSYIDVVTVFQGEFGTGAGTNNQLVFVVGAKVLDQGCTSCTAGGCLTTCNLANNPTAGHITTGNVNWVQGRCTGGGNDNTACTANSTCTGLGVCLTPPEYTSNDVVGPMQLIKASDNTAITGNEGAPTLYTVQAYKSGGGFTIDRNFRILGFMIKFNCPSTGTNTVPCPNTIW